MRMNVLSSSKRIICVLCILGSSWLHAETIVDASHFLPTDSKEARWVFSGVVANEKGEQYGYFFQMTREGTIFHSQAAIFDVQTKTPIMQDESAGEVVEDSSNRWHVGHAFLHFNPINDSWVFGVQQANKAGFNFRVDMLKPAEPLPVGQGLRPGIDVLVSQAHALNGHIYGADGTETFVTAKHAWFRQMAITTATAAPHAVKGILCRFNDDSAFYSVNLPEADAIRGAIAGRFDADGVSTPMSQFIHVAASSDGRWTIHIPSPQERVIISAFLKQSSMISGVAELGDRTGFCLLSEDSVGHLQPNIQTV